MPKRDGTGPMGYAPQSGMGAGSCTDKPDPQIPGRGYGMGYGRGHCFRGGTGHRAGQGGPFVQPTPQEERSFLEEQIEGLQNSLNHVKQRLEELSTQETKES